MRDHPPGELEQYVKGANTCRQYTLRERLINRMKAAEDAIAVAKQEIEESKTVLKTLDANKDLEMILNLTQKY